MIESVFEKVNTNKFFVGFMMIILTIGGRFIISELSEEQEESLSVEFKEGVGEESKFKFSKLFLFFTSKNVFSPKLCSFLVDILILLIFFRDLYILFCLYKLDVEDTEYSKNFLYPF